METTPNFTMPRDIEQLHTTYDTDKANEKLAQGWQLLAVAAGQQVTGPNEFGPYFTYCLGLPKSDAPF